MSRKIGMVQKTLHHWWIRKIANPFSKADDYEKHIFREHNQEADHWANVRAEEQRKAVIDRKGNADTWKAVKRLWDARCKDTGKSGCGVVIKGVDREWWVTINRIAVSLKVGTVMAAEIMGACVPTGIPDLVFHKCPCAEYQPMYWHNYEGSTMCLVVVCKTKNDSSSRWGRVQSWTNVSCDTTFSVVPTNLSGCSQLLQTNSHCPWLTCAIIVQCASAAILVPLWRSWGDPKEASRFVLKSMFWQLFPGDVMWTRQIFPTWTEKSGGELRRKRWTWQQEEHGEPRDAACEGRYSEWVPADLRGRQTCAQGRHQLTC